MNYMWFFTKVQNKGRKREAKRGCLVNQRERVTAKSRDDVNLVSRFEDDNKKLE